MDVTVRHSLEHLGIIVLFQNGGPSGDEFLYVHLLVDTVGGWIWFNKLAELLRTEEEPYL